MRRMLRAISSAFTGVLGNCKPISGKTFGKKNGGKSTGHSCELMNLPP